MHIFLFIFFNLYIFVIIKGMLIIGGNYGRQEDMCIQVLRYMVDLQILGIMVR